MMNADTVFDAARRLQQLGTPYALVSVVKALAPASARPGDKAVVTADGALHGWIGGGCAQPVVVRTVRQALADGQARLIRISPNTPADEPARADELRDPAEEPARGEELRDPVGEPSNPIGRAAETDARALGEVLEFGMACHSGGTLELFVDPVLPPARLVVIGNSPVALSLTQLAPRVGFAVTLVAEGADAQAYPDAGRVIASDEAVQVIPQVAPGAWVVVATQGRRDLQGLRLALALDARQVSFVASARKAQVLKDSLRAAGSAPGAVAAIVSPAGYPMAADTPEEIALSVLAAVVSNRRTAAAAPEPAPAARPREGVPAGEPALAPAAAGGCCAGKPAAAAAQPASCCSGG